MTGVRTKVKDSLNRVVKEVSRLHVKEIMEFYCVTFTLLALSWMTASSRVPILLFTVFSKVPSQIHGTQGLG